MQYFYDVGVNTHFTNNSNNNNELNTIEINNNSDANVKNNNLVNAMNNFPIYEDGVCMGIKNSQQSLLTKSSQCFAKISKEKPGKNIKQSYINFY